MAIAIDLSGHTALVTGATGELGRVMALSLARAGANLVLHYRTRQSEAERLRGEVCRFGVAACALQADVGQLASVEQMREQILEAGLGTPDIVVACAVSQIHPWSTVLEEAIEDYEDQFRSCVLQNVHLAKVFVPAMQRAGWGRYIAINSENTMEMQPTQSAYVSGKRGMDGVLRVLAREVGPAGITVNQVAPGWTVSARDRSAGTEVSESYAAKVPLGRRGTDQEVANVVSFLASELASFVTGAFIPVSGGSIMPAI